MKQRVETRSGTFLCKNINYIRKPWKESWNSNLKKVVAQNIPGKSYNALYKHKTILSMWYIKITVYVQCV